MQFDIIDSMNINILPAIDLLDNTVVRLKTGDYNQVTSYGTPLECAKYWQEQGATRLHVVDLNGAKEGKPVNLQAVEDILSVGLEVQYGGGIRTWKDLEDMFRLGVQSCILGTVAINNQELLIQALSIYKERIILGLDARDNKVSINGWLKDSDFTTSQLLRQLVGYGVSRFIYTDINRDGLLNGPDMTGITQLCQDFPNVKCIISGGIGSLDDIKTICEARNKNNLTNIEGIISGKALYEKKLDFKEAQNIVKELIY